MRFAPKQKMFNFDRCFRTLHLLMEVNVSELAPWMPEVLHAHRAHLIIIQVIDKGRLCPQTEKEGDACHLPVPLLKRYTNSLGLQIFTGRLHTREPSLMLFAYARLAISSPFGRSIIDRPLSNCTFFKCPILRRIAHFSYLKFFKFGHSHILSIWNPMVVHPDSKWM